MPGGGIPHMSDRPSPPEVRYAELVEAFQEAAGVTLGSGAKKGFGASALQVNGKIFALLSDGRLVVKLPRQRVDALVAAGAGERFDPRRDGRLMKEWLVLESTSADEWRSLAREARTFVAAQRCPDPPNLQLEEHPPMARPSR